MKKILLVIFLLLGYLAQAQTVGQFRYDTTKFLKVGGRNHVMIENLIQVTDSNYKALVIGPDGVIKKITYWPGTGTGGSGSGITSLGSGWGLNNVNVSTYEVDSTEVATQYDLAGKQDVFGNQSAWNIYGNHTSGSAAPTFGKLNINSIDATGTPGSGNFLRGDGSWVAGALSPWLYNGNKIYYNTDNVGIGTNDPSTRLNVNVDGIGNPTITNIGLDSTGIFTSNNTAATASVLQQSPPIGLSWQSWNTTSGTSINNRVRFIGQPLSNSTGIGDFGLYYSTNGGAYARAFRVALINGFTLFDNGISTGGGGIQTGGNISGVSYTGIGFFTSNHSNPTGSNSATASFFSASSTSGLTNTTGTKVFNGFYNGSNINAAAGGGTVMYTGFKHDPTITSSIGLTHNAFWNVSGNNLFNTTSGSTGIGTSTPAASALLDLESTTQGLKLPNMTTAQINAITSPATGLTVYNTTENTICFYNGTTWQKVTSTNL